MKRCPKCQREYTDSQLEFCLEDGQRLIADLHSKTSVETVILPQNQVFPTLQATENQAATTIEQVKTTKVQELKIKAVDQGYKILEIAPIVVALFHNYWQWLYVDKKDFGSISEFLLSVNFIVWLFLLIIGSILGLSTLKFGRNKGFAVTSLIILAINFLLFMIPKR